jgi:hypothetical protein
MSGPNPTYTAHLLDVAEPTSPRAEVREYRGQAVLYLDGQEIARVDREYVYTRYNLFMPAADWIACGEALRAWMRVQP